MKRTGISSGNVTMKLLLLLLGVTSVHSQIVFTECPADWFKNNENCYKFVSYPRLKYNDASTSCQTHGATLISVNNVGEHSFITQWLEQYDGSRDTWTTSGVVSETPAGVNWLGDGTFTSDVYAWHANVTVDKRKDGESVIYGFDGVSYGWMLGDNSKNSSFICEIPLQDIYKVVEDPRDFDYGLEVDNPALVPKGPHFMQEPVKTTILSATSAAFLDCMASGNPRPEYTWWYGQGTRREKLRTGSGTRFVLTGGQLTIVYPVKDNSGVYQCQASNKFGSILSRPVSLSFGSLGNFSNVNVGTIIGDLSLQNSISCPMISGKPAINYAWYKQTPGKPMVHIRPEKQKHIFTSRSGSLYFSEVGPQDTDIYFCKASLTTSGNMGRYMGSSRDEIRLSKGVVFNVSRGVSTEIRPVIPDDFIALYPRDPKRGQTLRMECFAYGTTPLIYSWHRDDGKEMPPRASFSATKRVMTISNIQIEDSGPYRCRVDSKVTQDHAERTKVLNVESDPYFTFPLQNQHVDNGSRLSWHCEARGKPNPTITWYKNSEPIMSSPGIIINGNTMVIESVQKERDNAMYQCAASNLNGLVFSSAQIRVIEVAPTFAKQPVDSSLAAAINGNITIVCNPEAAPAPTYQWLRDDRDLGLVQGGSPSGNFQMMLNGNLLIFDVNRNNEGKYTCKVTNRLGEASSFGYLKVYDSIVISQKPRNVEEKVNETASMICRASAAPGVDFVYVWKFNDYIINFERDVEYRMGTGFTDGTLYVIGLQIKHTGMYTCQVTTAMDSKSASAYLTVRGPPGEPSGLRRGDNSGLDHEDVPPNEKYVRLYWSDGAIHGSDITQYTIEYRTNFNQKWRVHTRDVEASSLESSKFKDKKTILLTQLKPNALHEFRVRAINSYGIGDPSLPSEEIYISGVPPLVAPGGIRGGGGKVGDLTIRWTPLEEEDYCGENFRYKVEWRAKATNVNQDSKWENMEVWPQYVCEYITDIELGLIKACSHVRNVGKENYYMPYEARIQGVNKEGDGVWSGVHTIMSADGMPSGTPRNVHAVSYNATAIEVIWTPVPNTRFDMKGRLTGYRINYWNRADETEDQARFNIISVPDGMENIDRGLIIGLTPGAWYRVNVQSMNTAGYGPKSETYPMETGNYAPAFFPTEVHVYSIEGIGVEVHFRGISTRVGEEPLMGYKLQYWQSGENIRNAAEVDVGRNNYGVITNVSETVLYQLRVFGYSRGGQGARSSPAVYFTVGAGQIQVPFNTETTEVMAGGSMLQFSLISLLCSLLLSAAVASLHRH